MNWDTTNIFLYFFINFFDLWVILRYFNSVLKSIKKRRAFLYGLYLLFLLFFTLLIQYELEYSNLVSIALWSCMFLPTYEGGRRNKIGYAALLLGLAGFAQMVMYLIISSNLFAVYSFFVPHFVFFITTELAGRYQTVKGKRIDGKLLILLVTVPIISFIAMPCIVMLTEQMGNVSFGERTGMLLPVAVLILYVNIIVFYLYDTISSVFEVQKQKEEVAKTIFIPLTVGGGIKSISDFDRVLKFGADKVSVNSGAIENPELIREAAQKYGNQCVVLSADVKRVGGEFRIFAKGGRVDTGMEAIGWIKRCVELGAGEVVVNSIDTDGVKNGFDIAMLKAVCNAVNVPVIASGGAGSISDFVELFKKIPDIDAGLAASVFHFGEIKIQELKKELDKNNIIVRL